MVGRRECPTREVSSGGVAHGRTADGPGPMMARSKERRGPVFLVLCCLPSNGENEQTHTAVLYVCTFRWPCAAGQRAEVVSRRGDGTVRKKRQASLHGDPFAAVTA